jgi:hypothetical protein
MTMSSDWDDMWDYLENLRIRPAIQTVELPEWEPLDTGIEPLTRRYSGAYDLAMTDTTEDMTSTPMLGSREERTPYGFVNYKGKVPPPNPAIPMGPATFNEMLYPLTCDYDEKTDMTRVGFTLQAPDWGKILGTMPRE